MRVALQTSDGVVHWLAGQPSVSEREFSSAADIRKVPRIAVQTDSFIRATAKQHQDRKNLDTELGFSTTRKFATAAAAFVFMCDYDRVNPRTGTIILEDPLPGGGVTRRYMADALVLPPEIRPVGVTCLISYTVLGGEIKPTT